MTSAAARAVQRYTAWEPLATQAFDLLLHGTGQSFGVAATYDNGMIEDTDDPKGWLDEGDHDLDMNEVSAHARMAYAALQHAFEEGVKDWMDPIRTLSRTTGLRLYVNARFERVGTEVRPWFHIMVEPGEVVVEGPTLLSTLRSFDTAVSEAFA